MKLRTLMCLVLCGLMLSGCVIALGTGRSEPCPFMKHFEEIEMHEGEFAEFPGDPDEHLEQRMRELEMRAEELDQMERHLAERAEELERMAAELEEPEQ
jgi:hypothetical protein